jgi:hypothetical protein
MRTVSFILDDHVIAAILRHLRDRGRDPRALHPEHRLTLRSKPTRPIVDSLPRPHRPPARDRLPALDCAHLELDLHRLARFQLLRITSQA